MPVAFDAVICTVGNSLYNNLRRARTDRSPLLPPAMDLDNRQAVVSFVRTLSGSGGDELELCGAEICCLSQMQSDGHITTKDACLELLAQEGATAALVAQAIVAHQEGSSFKDVVVHQIEGLQESDHNAFRTEGLRNLLLIAAARVAHHQNRGRRVAFAATGGMKAQVAFATLLGQMFSIPVFYRSKAFRQSIALPPLPLAPDTALWKKHAHLFNRMADEEIVPVSELPQEVDARLDALIELAGDLVCLSPVGLLYHRFCSGWFDRVEPAVRLDPAPGHKIILPDHHRVPRMEAFLRRVAQQVDFVTIIESKRLGEHTLQRDNRFKTIDSDKPHLLGTYSASGMRCDFRVFTTAHNSAELDAACAILNELFPL